MNYKHFGELLKSIRKDNNLTLKSLAENVCSVRQLSRIENNENNPSVYILHNLSMKLNIDLQEYYKIYFTSQSFKSENLKMKLVNLIVQKKLYELRKYIKELESIEEFSKGENLQYIIYSKALCLSHLDTNYILSNEYCYEGLKIKNPSFKINKISCDFYSNISLTIINLLASNFNKLGKKDTSYLIFKELFLSINNYILNIPFPMYRTSEFVNKMYQSLSCNLSILNMDKKNYKESLEYVDKGIQLSEKENYMRFLPELLLQKGRLLLKMGLKEASLNNYINSLSFYKILRSNEETKKVKKEIEDSF